jgi:hypothetical protein
MEIAGSANAGDILGVALGLVVAVPLVVLAYHSMQRPRLRVVAADDGWRTTRRDAIQYVLSIGPLLLLWWGLLAVVLYFTASALDALGVLTVAAGVVVAVRVLAHVRLEWAHELAKAVPLTLIVVGLITRQVRPPTDLVAVGTDLWSTDISWSALVVVVAVDLAATAVWYGVGVRRVGPRGRAIPGLPAV